MTAPIFACGGTIEKYIGDAIVSAARTKPSDTAATVVAQLQDQGERALRGRAGAVRIWTRGIVG
jgi:class 3 adenylate cyclase